MDLKDLVAQPWENEQLYECLGDQMKEIKEEPTDSWKRAEEPQPLEELEQMPKLEPMVERPSGPHIIKKFTCSLCSEKQLNYKIKEIQTENDKLVIIVGFLVCKYVELNQAVQLMESEAKLLVCNQHIPMVVDEILKLVGVQDHEQFPQNYAIQQLMTIVDSVQTSITAIQFWTMFNGFVHNVGKILEVLEE
uniref:MIF4G_like_2 domain-containing protein n=1 Tax=Caenorhabditis tropicalis TaxID=1561998 RepID=A0A1I7T6G1_9PELO